MAKTDIPAISAKTISVNGVPISGSLPAYGPYTTFDQLDADVVLALNGVVIQGAVGPGVRFANFDHINVLSGVSVAETVRYGTASTPASNAATGPIGIGGGTIPLPGPTPTVPTTPTETASPSGDRTVLMTQRQTLPDGAFPLAANVGYPCTGFALDRTDGSFLGSHGSTTASLNAGFVRLSPTFALLAQYTVGSMGLPAGSVQGIDIDRSDDTVWFILKATANGAYLVHCTRTGTLISSLLLTDATWNGLAYDSRRDCLIMMKDSGAVSWITKPAVDATTIAGTGKVGFTAAGTNNDMLHYDPLRDELLVSGGANETAGTIDVYSVSATSAPSRLATITLDQAMAIEGVVRRGNDLIVVNDQHTHPVSGQTTNQVQTYANAMVTAPATASPPVFAFAATPVALEGDAQTITVNATRNNTTGDLVLTYQAKPAVSSSADANDFGGAFPSGTFTIPAAGNSATFTITSSEDTVQEGNENYAVDISYNGAVVATGNFTIGEDDAPAGSYQAESTALFARMTTQPTEARKTAIDNVIASLKTAGVWSKLENLHVYAAHEAPTARLNWVADARNAAFVSASGGDVLFTVDRGALNQLGAYIDYGFSPATATKFLQDDASLGVWVNDSAASATGTATLGVIGSNQVGLNPRATSDVAAARINSGSASTGGPVTDAKGFTVGSRLAGPAVQLYKNGAAIGAVAAPASVARVTGNFRTGLVNTNDTISRNSAAVYIGGGVTAPEQQALYNALATYMTAVGNV